jgi:hypothetical protein
MLQKYNDISITWEGDLTSMSGWARHARSIVRPLVEGGASVHLSLKQPGRPEIELDDWWGEHFTTLSKASPGYVKVNHGSIGNVNRNVTGGPTVLLTHWETNKIPVQWVSTINDHFTELWVPTKQLLIGNEDLIKIPTRVVPCAIDVPELLDSMPSKPMEIVGVDDNNIVFGTVGHWNQRRNMSDVILAYLSEFNSQDNVSLVIKTFGNTPGDPNERQKIVQLVRDLKGSVNKPNMPQVIVLQDIFSEVSFNAILNRFSIYVSSSRGDSKDIAMQKSAALGRQCVYVDSLVHRDYTALDSSLMYPVGHVQEPVIQMGTTYSAMDSWARPDVLSMSAQMRQAQVDFLTKNIKKDRTDLQEKIAINYNPDVLAGEVADAVRTLMGDKRVVTI